MADQNAQVLPSLDRNAGYEIKTLSERAAQLEKRFRGFFNAREIEQSVLTGNECLEFDDGSNPRVFRVTHLGTTVRFELLLALDLNSEPVGKVVCMQCDSVWTATERRTLLGEFTINSRGFTNFALDERGMTIQMPDDADRILAHYLKQAHVANLKIKSITEGIV